MKINDKGLTIIKTCEGCVLNAYLDSAKVPTIGYGHTRGVKLGDKCTIGQAEEWLKEDIEKAETNVNSFKNIYNFNENEFSALVSFAYNIGSINQLTAKGTRTKEQIASKILEYNKCGGKVLNGLANRRKLEHDLFLTGNSIESTVFPVLRKGDKGYYVGLLQDKLLDNKFKTTSVNGRKKTLVHDEVFGIVTERKVKDWQNFNGLKSDGIVGKKTWHSLVL